MSSNRICPFFGAKADLPRDKLPTYGDVRRFYNFLFDRIKEEKSSNKPPEKIEVNNRIKEALEQVWDNARLFCKSSKSISNKLFYAHQAHQEMLKSNSQKSMSESVRQSIIEYSQKDNELFDISNCQCTQYNKCELCSYTKVRDLDFLLDQQTERLETIAVDYFRDEEWAIAKQQLEQDKLKSLRKIEKQIAKQNELNNQFEYVQLHESSALSAQTENLEAGSEYDPICDGIAQMNQSTQNRTNIDDFAKICIRYEGIRFTTGVAAQVATALLHVMGIVTKENPQEIIIESKLQRSKDRVRKEVIEEDTRNQKQISNLTYDSKINQQSLETTEKVIEIDSVEVKSHRTTKTPQETFCLMEGLGAIFLDLLTIKPKQDGDEYSGAEKIAHEIVDHLGKDRLKDMESLSCDGCATNTGWKGGVNRFIEEILEKALFRIACLMHGNELPLKNMVYQLDGASTSEGSYKGVLGKMISDKKYPPHKRPIVAFEPIPLVDMPQYKPKSRQSIGCNDEDDDDEDYEDNPNDFDISNDQDVLFQLILATGSGNVHPRLASTQLGRPSTCRWVTTGSNLCRLYQGVTEDDFLENPESFQLLKTLVTYVCRVYGPMIANIKMNPNFAFGAEHFHRICKLSQFLNDEEHDKEYQPPGSSLSQTPMDVVKATLKRNSFCAHPENIIVRMLVDEDEVRREEAIDMIRSIREKEDREKKEEEQEAIRLASIPPTRKRKSTSRATESREPPKKKRISKVRYYKQPGNDLIFDADNYWEMLPLGEMKKQGLLTEPPVTKEYSLDDLRNYKPPNILCHSQPIEQLIQHASIVTSSVSDPAKRKADMIIGIESRKKFPNLRSKGNYIAGMKK